MTANARLATVAAIFAVISFPGIVSSQSSDDETSAPEYSRKGADSCLACHDDQKVLSVFQTAHAVPGDANSPFGHGQLQCEACHGPGGDHAGRVRRGQERPPVPAFSSMSSASVADQNGNCIACHSGDQGFAWHASGHDSNSVSCAGCHTVHADNDPVLATSTQVEVCFDCHQQQRTQSMKPYAHPIRQGKMECASCHSPHGETTDLLLARQTLNDTCYDCHAEMRGPYLWEHAPVSEDCSNCHEPHGSSQPGMLSMRAPLLCQGCHSQDGHPSLPQDDSGLASGVPSQYLLGQSCLNCHSEVHGSNHPSGSKLMR
ncbi:MAG: DmsE family decaheme c-type cytochrome [Gammaproteobacteria bacterium]|nr:DmsE family decaheme c-type cytochrome [Gammaproteobacteria bacterium]